MQKRSALFSTLRRQWNFYEADKILPPSDAKFKGSDNKKTGVLESDLP